MKRPVQRSHFTLVEMMVAMVILVIMIGILFKFLAGAQDAWSTTRANSEIYENARLFFDIVTRDLQAMVVNDVSGAQINYSVDGLGELDSGFKFACVSASGIGTDSSDESILLEVGYQHDESAGTIVRYMTSMSEGPEAWNFYDSAAVIWADENSWGPNPDSAILVKGAKSVTFTAYSDHVTVISNASETTKRPAKIEIDVSLYDPRKTGTSGTVIDESLRTFRKTVYLR